MRKLMLPCLLRYIGASCNVSSLHKLPILLDTYRAFWQVRKPVQRTIGIASGTFAALSCNQSKCLRQNDDDEYAEPHDVGWHMWKRSREQNLAISTLDYEVDGRPALNGCIPASCQEGMLMRTVAPELREARLSPMFWNLGKARPPNI